MRLTALSWYKGLINRDMCKDHLQTVFENTPEMLMAILPTLSGEQKIIDDMYREKLDSDQVKCKNCYAITFIVGDSLGPASKAKFPCPCCIFALIALQQHTQENFTLLKSG